MKINLHVWLFFFSESRIVFCWSEFTSWELFLFRGNNSDFTGANSILHKQMLFREYEFATKKKKNKNWEVRILSKSFPWNKIRSHELKLVKGVSGHVPFMLLLE
jgi:hypothetical protein